MFTGLIQGLGEVKEIKRAKGVNRLSVIAGDLCKNAGVGDSVSVNGACLTLVKSGGNELVFEIMDESLKKTNLSRLRAGDRVNLEPSLRLGDKVGGHLVSGHIDGIARLRSVSASGQTRRFQIGLPREFMRFIVPKGSIAVNGVSLTVGEVGPDWFAVHIIPHTLKSTTFSSAKAGDSVNIELDLAAKYAQKVVRKDETITENFLKERGFI